MRTLAALLIVVMLGLPGCGGSTAPAEADPMAKKIGRSCRVQFRRGDALGAGGNIPVPLMTDNINGADVSLRGTLAAVGASWVVIDGGGAEYCIPRESILLMEFRK